MLSRADLQEHGSPEAAREPVASGEPAGTTPPADGFWMAECVEEPVAELLEITGMQAVESGIVFYGTPREEANSRFEAVAAVVEERGFDLRLLEADAGRAAALVSVRRPDAALQYNPLWNALLLLATLATTVWAGALHRGVDLLAQPGRWAVGLPYALALLAILGVHELGHYLVARRRDLPVTLPYFIPAPFFLGTFGAFIRMGSQARSRSTYFDVAVAGPLAGLVVAVGAVVAGLAWETPLPGHGMDPRSSALFYGLYRFVGGDAVAPLVELGPVAFAGWLGLLVTALNLIPVGQLDGGHIAYALWGGRRASAVGMLAIGVLVTGGLLYSGHWLMWALIIWFIGGIRHPPAANDLAPLDPGRRVLAYLTLALLLAIVLPWPA